MSKGKRTSNMEMWFNDCLSPEVGRNYKFWLFKMYLLSEDGS